MSQVGSDSEVVVELAEEFIDRYRRGERPPLGEYTSRYPHLKTRIEDVFPAMAMMENIAIRDSSGEGSQSAPEEQRPAHPPSIGDYRIIREVGRGGMGIVYEAEQLSLGRRVALKVLPQQMLLDKKHKRRFEREAKAAAKLHHTNIVPVFGVGEQDGLHYYVMQFIQGLGLDEVIGELQRMREASLAGKADSQAALRIAPRSGDIAAGKVVRSLVTGEFERTVLTDDGESADGGPVRQGSSGDHVPQACEAQAAGPGIALEVPQSGAGPAPLESSALRDTSSGRLSDSFALSGSFTLPGHRDVSDSTSGSRARRKQTFWTSVAHIGQQVASALQYAHEQGITHRDIKPSNLLLDMQGTVWITDFGLAKISDQQEITHTGDILGTLRYMPPEAFEGRSDARGDQYSLGLTLYELLAQKPAFEEKDRRKLIKLVTTTEPTRIEALNRDVPRDLATIVHKAIDHDASHRYASAGELADDLQRFLDDEPIKARRLSVAERLGRWRRRNRGLAVSLTVVAVLLLVINIAGPVVTWHVSRLNRELQGSQDELSVAVANLTRTRDTLQGAVAHLESTQSKLIASRDTARGQAEQLQDQAVELRRQQQRAERNLYALRIALAENHLNSGDPVNALRSLEAAIPEDGETDRRWEWHYLNRWSNSAERSFRGHSQPSVYALAFSPDGRLLASAGGGNPYYNTQGRQSIRAGEVLIRDFATGRVLHTLERHENIVMEIAFSPDGSRLATAGHDHRVIVWNVETAEPLFELDGPSDAAAVWSIQFSGNRERVLTVDTNGAVFVYSTTDGHLLHSFGATSAVFSHDGSQVYFLNEAGVHTLDLETREENDLFKTPRIEWRIYQLVQSPGGRYLGAAPRVAVPNSTELLIWDLQTQQLLHHLTMDERLDSLTFSADDKYLAVAGATPVVRVFDVTSGRQTASLMAPGKSVTETAFAPDGRWLATSGTDGTVRVFRSGQDSRGTRISTGQDEMPALAFDADRPELRTAAWNAHRGMSTWDANTGERLQHFSAEFNREHKWPRGDYAFSTDGRRLAAARHDNPQIVTVWDAVSGQELISLAEHPGFVRAVAFSRDDALLATAAVEKTGAELCIWNAATGELIRTQDVGKVLVSAIAFSHDGKSVATGGQPTGTEPGVSIWDAGTGAARFHFDGPALVFGLAFSPDGGRLAAADYGRQRVSVWDAERGEPIGEMPGIAAVSDVAWSPDGTRLAAIGYDANVHLLDGETLEELIVLRTLGPPSGTMGFTPRVAFSPDGSKIAGNSPHGTVTVWDADDGNTEPFRFPAPRPAGSGNSGRDPDNDRE